MALKKGFSLIELIVVIGLLSLLMLAISSTMLMSIISSNRIRTTTKIKQAGGYAINQIQSMIRKILQDFFGEDFKLAAHGTDGCSLPVYDCQIQNLAKAWLRLLTPASEYSEACKWILKAMAKYPYLIEGTDTVTSEIIKQSQGDVIVKGGAAGVYTGLVISKRVGFAFKCIDGQMDPTKEVLFDFLRRHEFMDSGILNSVYSKTLGPPHNWAGETTGHREILT